MTNADRSNRVLMLARQYPPTLGGVEVVIEQHAGYYRSLGCDVHVLTMNPRPGSKACRRIGQHGEIIDEVPAWVVVQSLLFSPRYVWMAIYRWLFCGPWRVVEIQYPSPLDAFLAVFLGILRRQSLVITFHAEIFGKNPVLTRVATMLNRRLLQRASRVIFTSEGMATHLANKFGIAEKARVCPIAFESPASGPPPGGAHTSPVLRLAFIGRLVPYKGLRYLIDALAGLARVDLTIFGDGPLREELKAQAAELALDSTVRFAADLSEPAKQHLLGSCDVLVLPSVTGAEAFGIVQLEAMSRGLAVINTDLATGVPDVSRHMESGLTVAPARSEEIRQAICLLRDDRELLRRLQAGALKRAELFTRPAVRHRFLKAIAPHV